MPQPGMLDFAALSKEAQTTIDNDSVAVSKTVKVAASENSVPPAEVAQVTDNSDFDNDDNSVEAPEPVEVAESEETASSANSTVAPQKSQAELKEEVLELPDNAKVKIKIDGEETTVTVKDYKDILRKNATITQRMQNFAETRKQFDAAVAQTVRELEQRERAIQSHQPKQDPLSEALIAALKGQVAPKPRDPNEIVTLADVHAERESLRQEFEQQRKKDREDYESSLEQAAVSVREQARINQERQKFYTGLNSILNKDEYKALGEVIPRLSALTEFHIQSVAPQNLAEALEAAEDYLKERAEVFKKHSTAKEQKQQAKAAKQKMESTDGATPTIAKSNVDKGKKFVGKNGKLDFAAMSREAMAYANSMN